MFDSSSIAAAELLSHFGRNTAVTVRHNYGHDTLEVVSASTGNVIATVVKHGSIYSVDTFSATLEQCAALIMEMKKFPRNRKMNKAWSPIRFNTKSVAMMEADSGVKFN